MKLSDQQESMLAGEQGPAVQRCLRLVQKLGEVFGAHELVSVDSVQVSGVSYKSIGDPGLDFLEDFVNLGVQVRVPTFLNPAGIDLQNWRDFGFDPQFAERQKQILGAYQAMGIQMTITCAPYLLPSIEPPQLGRHIAWAESSAVSYANSILGARTNREGGPSSLAAAICGYTPKCGLHLNENRLAQLVVDVQAELSSLADFGALGIWAGRLAQNRVPYFAGLSQAQSDQLKNLGAAMAASGAVALYHVEGTTPEADQDLRGLKNTPSHPNTSKLFGPSFRQAQNQNCWFLDALTPRWVKLRAWQKRSKAGD